MCFSSSRLFEKEEIAGLQAKNRIAMPAVHLGMAENGAPSQSLQTFYEQRAEGGAGIITVGVCNTWPSSDTRLYNFLDLAKDTTKDPMKELVKKVKKQGALIGAQLSPLVGYNDPNWRPDPEILPKIIESFGAAARRAMEAGFDFVEIMLSGGSLLSHLLSPAHNDFDIPGYSQDLKARFRAAAEAVQAIHKHTGRGIPVTARIHGHEFLPDGYGSLEARRIAKLLEEEGVAAINVTGAGHRTALPQITFHTPPMVFAHLARQVKEAVNVPVFVGGQLRSKRQAEDALRISGANFVNVARALIVDPNWPKKAEQGKEDLIVPCMACCSCFDQAVGGKPIRCSLNPTVGILRPEHRTPKQREIQSAKKRALVVGSGPAGLQAAWDLQALGFNVIVQEKSKDLGGKWHIASKLRETEILDAPLNAFIARLKRAGVKFEPSTIATPESVRALGPDVLVLAVGAKHRKPSLPGIENHPRVLFAEQVIENPEPACGRIAIIGAGGVGVETAIFLASLGEPAFDTLGFLAKHGDKKWLEEALASNAGRKITLLRRRGFAGKGLGRSIRWTLVNELKRLNVSVINGCEYKTVNKHGIEIKREKSEDVELIQADTIIFATGFEIDPDFETQFKNAAQIVISVGSACEVSNIGDAVHSAHNAVELMSKRI